jgi:hypothetical protein
MIRPSAGEGIKFISASVILERTTPPLTEFTAKTTDGSNGQASPTITALYKSGGKLKICDI